MEQPISRSGSRVLSSLRDLKLSSERFGKLSQSVRRPSKTNVVMGDFLEDDAHHQCFTKVSRTQTPNDKDFICRCLAKHFVFRQLVNDTAVLDGLLMKFFCCRVERGQYIIKQNDDASSFFILEKGRLGVIINGQNRRQLQPGQGFGELALLYNSARSASLVALQDVTLWGIDRSTFRKVVTEVCEREAGENRQFIQKVKFFDYLTPRQRDSVANVLIQQRHSPGQKIVVQGDPGASFYIIKSGLVRIVINGHEVNRIGAGKYFGEAALVSASQPRNATVETVEDTVVLALGRESIRTILGKGIHTIVYRNKIAHSLGVSKYFSQLDGLSLERIIDCLVIEKVAKGASVVIGGTLCRDKMFFVLEGSLQQQLSHTEIDIEHADVMFGQRSITEKYAMDRYEKTLAFQEDGAIAYASYNQILAVMAVPFEKLVQRHSTTEEYLRQCNESIVSLRQSAMHLKLEDLQLIKKLGSGQFGVVYLVRHANSHYALKCVDKAQIVNCKLERQIVHEKEALQRCDHPFLLNYCRSFKDDRFIYFLTEFINGLELFDVIRNMGLLSCLDARFYIASMMLALEYLHQRDIVYRDLKPENAIIDTVGYLKLIDMGTCKHINSKAASFKTFTIIGTPHYMAPQVLAGKGYSFNCDIWSLGVCAFELMCGNVPFGEDTDDPYEIYEQVIQKQLEFPSYVTDPNVKSFLGQLLSKQQEARFTGSFTSLKNHPWFNQLEWDLLICKKLEPPYRIPKDKLIDSKVLNTAKGKHICEQFRTPQGQPPKLQKSSRKDLDPHWDCIF